MEQAVVDFFEDHHMIEDVVAMTCDEFGISEEELIRILNCGYTAEELMEAHNEG